MAAIITIAQQKDGIVKSKRAATIAAALSPVSRVMLLDCDPDRGLARCWSTRRPASTIRLDAIGVFDVASRRPGVAADRPQRSLDLVLICNPPQIDTDARHGIRAADLAVIPEQPRLPDLWAADGTTRCAAAGKRALRGLLNRGPPASHPQRCVGADIARLGQPVLRATFANRTAFASVFAEGLAITEAAPRSTAGAEVRELVCELQELI
jgi:chromosome partitioning protein